MWDHQPLRQDQITDDANHIAKRGSSPCQIPATGSDFPVPTSSHPITSCPWVPKKLVGSFLLIVAKRGIKRLERLVHCTYRIELRSHELFVLLKSIWQA